MPRPSSIESSPNPARYDGLLVEIAGLLDLARHNSAQVVNALISAAEILET